MTRKVHSSVTASFFYCDHCLELCPSINMRIQQVLHWFGGSRPRLPRGMRGRPGALRDRWNPPVVMALGNRKGTESNGYEKNRASACLKVGFHASFTLADAGGTLRSAPQDTPPTGSGSRPAPGGRRPHVRGAAPSGPVRRAAAPGEAARAALRNLRTPESASGTRSHAYAAAGPSPRRPYGECAAWAAGRGRRRGGRDGVSGCRSRRT